MFLKHRMDSLNPEVSPSDACSRPARSGIKLGKCERELKASWLLRKQAPKCPLDKGLHVPVLGLF